jgi:hypothetical protein
MEPLPKIARDRLGATPPAEHPDADLLTAFAERSLSDRERVQVTDHLSHCAQCRQVVAVAVPELEPVLADAAAAAHTAGAKTAPARRRLWLRSPVLRWGALAACVVVVGAAVLNYRRVYRIEPFAPAASRDMKSEAPSEPGNAGAPESREYAVSALKAELKGNAQPGLAAKQVPEKTQTAKGAGTAGKLESRGRFDEMAVGKTATVRQETIAVAADKKAPASQSANAVSQIPAAVAQAPPPPPLPERAQGAKDQVVSGGAAKETVEVAGTASQVESQTAGYLLKRKPGEEKEDGRMKATVAKPSASFSARIADAAANEGLVGGRPVRWSLSTGGLPQRSFDSGVTWQEVAVDGSSAFRTLSAAGQEVWVGGAAGLLYHSSDNGAHWTRVTPSAGGVPLQANINRIEFVDALHGRLETADGATWITSDGGKTWQKN